MSSRDPPLRMIFDLSISKESGMDEWKSVAVIGAGPVGSLAALYFARHVARVDLYDLRWRVPCQTTFKLIKLDLILVKSTKLQ